MAQKQNEKKCKAQRNWEAALQKFADCFVWGGVLAKPRRQSRLLTGICGDEFTARSGPRTICRTVA